MGDPFALDETELAYAIPTDMLLVQLHEIVGACADRALRLDLLQYEPAVFGANVQQVALPHAQDSAKLRGHDHSPQLVDLPRGPNHPHFGAPPRHPAVSPGIGPTTSGKS